jgi:endogenous inhibitor of DNA gyrase (YacG/DUF329 family)
MKIKYHCHYCFTVFKKTEKNERKVFCSDSCRKLQHKLNKGKKANPYAIANPKIKEEYVQILNARNKFEKRRSGYTNTAVDICFQYLKMGHYKKINAYLPYLTAFLNNH